MRVAVLGGGIAGLGAARALAGRHEVDLFEAQPEAGGHAHTVLVGQAALDMGFVVYHDRTYPHFRALLGCVMSERASFLLVLALGISACGGGGGSPEDPIDEERPIAVSGGIEYGSSCEIDEQCGDVALGAECCTGGKCGPDGWCSPRCETDRDCPDGFFCIDHDGARCFVECADDRDCPPDFECEDKSDHFTCRYKEDDDD